MPKNNDETTDTWLLGAIFAVLGLYEMIYGNKQNGFLAFMLGIVFMAAVNEDFRKQIFDFFFGILKKITRTD